MTKPLAHDTCTADVKVHVIHEASSLALIRNAINESLTTMYMHERLHVIRHG